jgi:hypothetical protein
MNKISSRDFVMECLRETRRPDTLEYSECVLESRREAPPIYIALIDSRRPRTTDALSKLNTVRVPSIVVLVRLARLGSSALIFARSRSGIGKGPMNRTLRKKLERGISYEV